MSTLQTQHPFSVLTLDARTAASDTADHSFPDGSASALPRPEAQHSASGHSPPTLTPLRDLTHSHALKNTDVSPTPKFVSLFTLPIVNSLLDMAASLSHWYLRLHMFRLNWVFLTPPRPVIRALFPLAFTATPFFLLLRSKPQQSSMAPLLLSCPTSNTSRSPNLKIYAEPHHVLPSRWPSLSPCLAYITATAPYLIPMLPSFGPYILFSTQCWGLRVLTLWVLPEQ